MELEQATVDGGVLRRLRAKLFRVVLTGAGVTPNNLATAPAMGFADSDRRRSRPNTPARAANRKHAASVLGSGQAKRNGWAARTLRT